jgi:hypothetical protein
VCAPENLSEAFGGLADTVTPMLVGPDCFLFLFGLLFFTPNTVVA